LTHLVFNVSASLGYYCHPPASWNHSLHFNENIAAVMKKGFNLEELEKNNAHSIQGEILFFSVTQMDIT
jgi:IS30 family transposase